ncbi:hypothetical protein ACWDUD_19550 [Rhodococcus sp. NPDC003382]|uniref:hypothetical protein n=1 Tax=unclassified Rhodococcus (in: high G+C Gram-positive bacteria) TaxID=192944 RepID=UPI0018CED720|nr:MULTISPECIES: hypothetical protein [unclassified Rhodococcus (in: high G+C Gram-positive bacteria)]MBH0118598.1 hypothetical protein [Rhodococcus sp. CX]MCK8672596.1 hypothetical protein [Rhodococcus sp. HM1]
MLYLLAFIGAVTLAVLLWKAFGPAMHTQSGRALGPDDDPEFLWKVDREVHRRRTEGPAAPDQDPGD